MIEVRMATSRLLDILDEEEGRKLFAQLPEEDMSIDIRLVQHYGDTVTFELSWEED